MALIRLTFHYNSSNWCKVVGCHNYFVPGGILPNTQVRLVRETTNQQHPNAIRVERIADDRIIGYLRYQAGDVLSPILNNHGWTFAEGRLIGGYYWKQDNLGPGGQPRDFQEVKLTFQLIGSSLVNGPAVMQSLMGAPHNLLTRTTDFPYDMAGLWR